MHIPSHFEVTDEKEILSFIEQNSFGQLVSTLNNRLFTTHMPFMLSSDKQKLLGHIALNNPQHAGLEDREILITLDGPHGYISPSWYSTPGVPTWNYQAVHIYGRCKLFDDSEKLESLLRSLTEKYEAGLAEPWTPDYNPQLLKVIIGLEVSITEVQCKFKLSQNRSDKDRQKVAKNLEQLGSYQLAKVMDDK